MEKENVQRNFYNLVIPPNLKEDEFVRLVAFKDKGKPTQKQKVFFIKTFTEFQEIISKYKHNWDLYLSISSVKGNDSGTTDKLYRRQVLFFDFDKKDYPQYENIEDFTAHIKRIMPNLFNHAIVDSGNGFHFYIATNITSDIKRATHINKEIASFIGADMKAVLSSQIVRIPTSLNHKQEQPKPVNVVVNTYGTVRYKPYKLKALESILMLKKKSKAFDDNFATTPKVEFDQISNYYCIEKMIAEGCNQGERNFALGRITKYLQMKGYKQSKALQIVKEWNLRCRPAKDIKEVSDDFNKYWQGNYKLLGCSLHDERQQSILSNYCNKAQCKTIQNGEIKGEIEGKEFIMDNHLLQRRVISKLTGNHYLILSVLHINEQGLSMAQIKKEITNKKTKRPCLSYNTLKKIIDELYYCKHITKNGDFYKLIDIKNYGFGYTRFYYSATILLINKLITSQEYLVYLCLVKNLQLGNSVTYDSIGEELNMDKSNVGKYINSLNETSVLKIEKVYSDKGVLCNRYVLVA